MVAVGHRAVGDTSRRVVLWDHRLLLSLRGGLLLRLRVAADGRFCFRRGCRGAGLLVLLAVLRRVGRGAIWLRGPRRGRGTARWQMRVSSTSVSRLGWLS